MFISESLVRITLRMSMPLNFTGAYYLAFPEYDTPVLYLSLLSMVVAFFGGIYGWISIQPSVFQPLLFVSAVGKIGFFLTAAYLWPSAEVSPTLMMILVGDLILGVMWFSAMYSNKTKVTA